MDNKKRIMQSPNLNICLAMCSVIGCVHIQDCTWCPRPFQRQAYYSHSTDEDIEAQRKGKDLIDFTLLGMSSRGNSEPRDARGDFELEKTRRGSF